jgi:hypothetical protein
MSFGLGQAEPSDIFIVNIELWSAIVKAKAQAAE